MSLPGPEHLLFIPSILLIGLYVGWMLGGRAAREKLEKQRARLKE